MFDKFVPDIYQKSIYTIDYEKLKKNGIKCLVFDLNNTLAPTNLKKPNKKIRDLIEELKDMKFKVIILSNDTKARVEPFKDLLGVDSACMSFKPLKKKYKKIQEIYNYKDTQIACIGDQLVTDILGANRMGFTSILVNPISTSEFVTTKISRIFENIIIKSLTKDKLLRRGKYYE